jgi:hypothetical protein
VSYTGDMDGALTPRYSKEEFARRGEEIYDRDILSQMKPEDKGKFVLIDIETGAYELDWDEMVASDRLFVRHPDAQVWMRRVGFPYARRLPFRRGRDAALARVSARLPLP